MRDFRDAKAMAQTLRQVLKDKSISLTHSESLELVARLLGLHDWNELAARIQSARRPRADIADEPAPPQPVDLVPTVPLRDLVLFPQMTQVIFVGRDGSKRAIARAFAGDKRIFAVTQKRAADDNPAVDGLYRFGVVVRLIDRMTLPDGNWKVIVQALERASVSRFVEGAFLRAEIARIEDHNDGTAEDLSLSRQVLGEYESYANDLDAPPQVLTLLTRLRDHPGVLADTLAQLLKIGIDQRQSLLETINASARLEKILTLMQSSPLSLGRRLKMIPLQWKAR